MYSLVGSDNSTKNHGGLLKEQHVLSPAQPSPSHNGVSV